MSKSCTRCKVVQALSEFPKFKQGRDGLHPECKTCRRERAREWKARNPTAASRHMKSYRANHREAINERARARLLATDPATRHAVYRKAYVAGLKQKKEYSERYRKEHPELYRASSKKWAAANPEKHRALRSTRRARELGAQGDHSAAQVKALFAAQKGKCAVCRTVLPANYHKDHIQPLARCGSNAIDNIQLLCPPCNQGKGAKDPVDFMRQQGFLL